MGIPPTIIKKQPSMKIDGRGVEESYKPVIPVVFGRTCCITTGTPTDKRRGNISMQNIRKILANYDALHRVCKGLSKPRIQLH